MTVSDPGAETKPRKNRNRRSEPTEPVTKPNEGDEEAGTPPWTLLAMFGIAVGLLVLYGIFGAH